MARKVQKNVAIDAGVLAEFAKIANRKKQNHNAEIETMMKEYIARDGQMLADDIYAPRIAQAVKLAVEGQINRLAKMIYQAQINSSAALYSGSLLHIENTKNIEKLFETYLDPRLLKPDRQKLSAKMSFDKNGKAAIETFRKYAHDDVQKQKQVATAQMNA
ncbi:hypothetical protein [Priestia megaterium]|uniref:hypothetical protein n=1 Tax=Priestia megaterium TaxID=1404 RepID=UPI000BFD12E3|nr:hypothetical protein [Priestia megaterium]PGQ88339.1 hypothetical protein COA18_05260 [Priestia megaterium]